MRYGDCLFTSHEYIQNPLPRIYTHTDRQIDGNMDRHNTIEVRFVRVWSRLKFIISDYNKQL